MKKRFCFECGAEMWIQIITPTKHYRINDSGDIVSDDVNDEIRFQEICSENDQHMIDDIYGSNNGWVDEFKLQFELQSKKSKKTSKL